MQEVRKDVVGFEGYYRVSNLGNVMNAKGQLLKPKYSKKKKRPYPYFDLCKKGISKRLMQHILVVRAFIGLPPKGMETNHKDGNKFNNNITNLEYCTKSENIKHAIKNGLFIPKLIFKKCGQQTDG